MIIQLLNHFNSFVSVFATLFIFSINISLAQEKKENKNNYPDLGTVILAPIENNAVLESQFPIVLLGQTLNLRFDIINGNGEDYLARIIHCDRNWYVSDIDAIEFLSEFNEFRIDNKTSSYSTNTDYTHYNFNLPKVQISGNYIIEVYREDDENDVIFTRQFMVFQQIVGISTKLKKGISDMNTAEKQQFEIQINYGQASINNPKEELFVCIIKNNDWNLHRWLENFQFNNNHDGIIVFDPYDKNALFDGGNEYRIFDIRSSKYSRQNVRSIKKQGENIVAILELVEIKNRKAYSEKEDINGSFIISTDDQSKDPDIEGDYFDVKFQIDTPKSRESIYLIGDFTVGMTLNETKLKYNQNQKIYTGKFQLKQGFYNYSVIKNNNGKIINLDGNFFATQNIYHFLSYRKLSQNRYDELVGYKRFDTKN